jgi:hypothetical protein
MISSGSNIASNGDKDFNTFKFRVWSHLLFLKQRLPGVEPRRCIELRIEVHRDLERFLNVLSRPQCKKALDGNLSILSKEAERLKGILPKLEDFSLICSISLWCIYHLHEVFRHFLEGPIIGMAAHVYVYLQLTGSPVSIEELERFCQKHEDLLFWRGRPRTLPAWQASYQGWVIPTTQVAVEITRTRSSRMRKNYLLGELVHNEFKLASEVRAKKNLSSQQGSIFEMLVSELKSEIPYDTVTLYDKVDQIARGILDSNPSWSLQDIRADDQDQDVALRIYQHIAEAANPFISELTEQEPEWFDSVATD